MTTPWLRRAIVACAVAAALGVSSPARAAKVLYGFDSDHAAPITDWLDDDGAQNPVVHGSVALSGAAAFGSKAALFSGNEFAALEIPGSMQLGSAFTLAAMVNETEANFSRLFSSYDGGTPTANELVFDFNPSLSGTSFGVRAIVNGATVTRPASFDDGAYHHVAMTYDNGSVRLYLDGAQLGDVAAVPGGPVTLARNLRFGEDYPPTSLTNELFKGFADDILVYDRALAGGEIASLYQHGAAVAIGVRPPPPANPIALGSYVEMFVDRRMLETSSGVALKLHPPQKREITLQLNMLYELSTATYFTATRDEDNRVRLYYRGAAGGTEVTNMAIGNDGIVFERPALHIYERDGSTANSIVWQGPQAHNLTPFLDANPNAAPDAKWKALGGQGPGGMYALKSPDGIHWQLMQPNPLIMPGYLDSQNLAFWDAEAGFYRSYSRYYDSGNRAVQMSTSTDFINWTAPVKLTYDVPLEQFYTNGILKVPGAENVFLGFPMRYDPTRTNLPSPNQTGVTDAVFMTSRDGLHWDRLFDEPWIDEGFDSTRSNMPAWGIIETAPDEWSMYATERYRLGANRLRRLTMRPYGFASIQADASGGWFETPPVTFDGDDLLLNFRAALGGSVAVEIRDRFGVAIPGFTLAEAVPLAGDQLARGVEWTSGRTLDELSGQQIRLYVQLASADLYAIQFGQATLAADFNRDGSVDDADLSIWRAGFGSAIGSPINGDADADGDVDGFDFLIWQQMALHAQATPQSHQAPEPTTLACLVAPLLAAALRRRRESSFRNRVLGVPLAPPVRAAVSRKI